MSWQDYGTLGAGSGYSPNWWDTVITWQSQMSSWPGSVIQFYSRGIAFSVSRIFGVKATEALQNDVIAWLTQWPLPSSFAQAVDTLPAQSACGPLAHRYHSITWSMAQCWFDALAQQFAAARAWTFGSPGDLGAPRPNLNAITFHRANPFVGTVGDLPLAINRDAIKLGSQYYGSPTNPEVDPLQGMIEAITQAAPWNEQVIRLSHPYWTRPTGPNGQPYTPTDVAKVIAGWFPYLPTMPGNNYTWPADPSKWDPNTVLQLYQQAAALLGAAQVPADKLRHVPWGEIPWYTFPWQTVAGSMGDHVASAWLFFTRSMTTSTAHRPVQFSPGPGSTPPNFLNEQWTADPWKSVPWNLMSGIDPSIFRNQRVNQCLADPDAQRRLADMAQHKDCFIGAGPEKFADYLCKQTDGTYKDLAACGAHTTGDCGPGQTWDPNLGKCVDVPVVCQPPSTWDPTSRACVFPGTQGQIPQWVPNVNWACTPMPSCVYEQIAAAVPADQRCPPPGESWPECAPDWLAQHGVALPQQPTQHEPKKDNTTLYVLLAVAGTALVLGGVYAASR
jgi:hypothetical protein